MIKQCRTFFAEFKREASTPEQQKIQELEARIARLEREKSV